MFVLKYRKELKDEVYLVYFENNIFEKWEVNDFMKRCKNIYGWALIQILLKRGYQYVIFVLDELLKTTGDSELGCFLHVDLQHTDTTKNKARYFPICPEPKKVYN